MGLLSSLTGSSGAKAAKKAAAIQTQARNEASQMLGTIIPQFQPVANMFGQFAPAVQQGATMQGFAGNIDEILNSPTFDAIKADRMEAGQTQLANTGLSRSGAALRELAAIPTDLALNIEEMLNQRQTGLMGVGMQGMGTIADIIGQQANIKAGIGDVQAQGKLGAAASRAQGTQNMIQLASMAAGGYGASQGWFK